MLVSPTHAIIAVTERCNARCIMCDIWRKPAAPELAPDDYRRLPRALREINLTGGEPLLREDLADIVRVMQATCPGVRIVLSTNGLLPERLEAFLVSVERVAVRISLDGLDGLHDRIRGVPGAFEKVLQSLEIAEAAGAADLGICATMTKANAGRVKDVHDFACERGIQFTCTVAHSSSFFFGDQTDEEPDALEARADMSAIQARLYDSSSPKDWFRAYFISGLRDVLSGCPRPIVCTAGSDFFYMDPQGNVYPCHILDLRMGNIRDSTFQEMVRANEAVLRAVRSCTKRCWMTCTVAPEMRRKIVLFAAKVGWAKLVHHFRRAFGRR
jgi:MoaA/NifB/PqqE/SkfB family radical SAM enzyme